MWIHWSLLLLGLIWKEKQLVEKNTDKKIKYKLISYSFWFPLPWIVSFWPFIYIFNICVHHLYTIHAVLKIIEEKCYPLISDWLIFGRLCLWLYQNYIRVSQRNASGCRLQWVCCEDGNLHVLHYEISKTFPILRKRQVNGLKKFVVWTGSQFQV